MSINTNDFLYRNMTYRFRFLDAHYDTVYRNISFAVFYKSITNGNGSLSYVETFPPLYNLAFPEDMYTINMTIIGADAVLFN